MNASFGPRRGEIVDIAAYLRKNPQFVVPPQAVQALESFDQIYRSLCAVLYNYVPGSGHPGGSISSGRIVQALLFHTMDYDLSDPNCLTADIISYAAGHKALGLYAAWALRNEIARIARPELLPSDRAMQLRLEDLLGFRRNPNQETPLFREFRSRALDGHPTPATPFVKVATGASGVGLSSSVGLALGARDIYREDPPRVHVLEGEGGLTPGRVAEAMAGAGTLGLGNLIIHIDWNQASIDSNHVCREGDQPGDYVQWDPIELAYLHDFNVVVVPDGFDLGQILAAQDYALRLSNSQPTAIVYRTIKGWRYGIEGRASHGAGHALCSEGFYGAVGSLATLDCDAMPSCAGEEKRCRGNDAVIIESCYWEALQVVRNTLVREHQTMAELADALASSRTRLQKRARAPRRNAPRIEVIYDEQNFGPQRVPEELALKVGSSVTLRDTLGNALNYLNHASGGGFLGVSADLMGSTSLSNVSKGFPAGFLDFRTNPEARSFAMGGICEDAMSGVLSGLSSFGFHIGVGSSYGAFIAALGHISARLHCIGAQARRSLVADEPYKTLILVCAHAGLKTGEDGPTHADPQPLQLVQENFPRGTAITLTPWDAQEVWPLMLCALQKRPALLIPFVTRPSELVIDRAQMKLSSAADSITGVYPLRLADPKRKRDGTIVLQESGVTHAFVQDCMPRMDQSGFNMNIYYVASAELFDLLTPAEQERIFPEEFSNEAMGITGFTLPTMYRWVRSRMGRDSTLHPFMHGHYLGSGQGAAVLREAGLDGESQFQRVAQYVSMRRNMIRDGSSA